MPSLINLGSNVRAAYERLRDGDDGDDEDSVLDISENQDCGRTQKAKHWWDYLPLGSEYQVVDDSK